MKGRTGAALAAAVVAVALTGAPSAQAAGFHKRTLHFDVVVGPNDDQHCDVVGDLYTPDGASAAHPVPAVLTTNGFGGSKDDEAKFGTAFASQGYAVLSYSGLGFGGSGCKVTLDDRDYDGKAASQLITFLGGGKAAKDGTKVDYVIRDATAHDGQHHDFDPRAGMIGGSYGGEVQFATAGIDPRLDTIVPFITWNDLSYSLIPNNTAFDHGVTSTTPGVVKAIWSLLFTVVGIADGINGAGTDPSRILPCPNFATDVCPALLSVATGAPNDAEVTFLRHASVVSFMSAIKIPTMLLQGEADTLFNLQEAVATYRSLRAQGTPVKMIWQSWGHSHSTPAPGELNYDVTKPTYEGTAVAQWFDHYLKGVAAAPSLDFTFFRDWVTYRGDATPAYGRAPSYPVGRDHDLNLSGDGTLGPVASDASRTFLTTAAGVPTSYTELSAFDPGSSPVDLPGTSVAYDSGPLASPLDVIGVPSLDVRLAAPLHSVTGQVGGAGELALFLRLEDVAPDGSVTLPHKLVAPVRIADLEHPVHVELPGIVHRFAAGHRVRLVIYGGDLSYRGNVVPGPVTVLSSAARPSVLHLPAAGASDYGSVVGASAPRSCASRRAITLHLKRRYRGRVRSAVVEVAGRRVARLRQGRSSVRISLRGRVNGRYTVRIVMRLASGRRVVDTRRYRTCPAAAKRRAG
ncbi:MAG: transporter ATP-binding protein, partial [Solirubrobacterales bacterium]|nr:transporter ATP-binding protein [Solirubrobacterales bacterium]